MTGELNSEMCTEKYCYKKN